MHPTVYTLALKHGTLDVSNKCLGTCDVRVLSRFINRDLVKRNLKLLDVSSNMLFGCAAAGGGEGLGLHRVLQDAIPVRAHIDLKSSEIVDHLAGTARNHDRPPLNLKPKPSSRAK